MTRAEPRPQVEHPDPLPCPAWCTGHHVLHLEGSFRYVFHDSRHDQLGVFVSRNDEWYEHEAVRGGDWNVWRHRVTLFIELESGRQLRISDARCARDLLEYSALFRPGLAKAIRAAAALLGWVVE